MLFISMIKEGTWKFFVLKKGKLIRLVMMCDYLCEITVSRRSGRTIHQRHQCGEGSNELERYLDGMTKTETDQWVELNTFSDVGAMGFSDVSVYFGVMD